MASTGSGAGVKSAPFYTYANEKFTPFHKLRALKTEDAFSALQLICHSLSCSPSHMEL